MTRWLPLLVIALGVGAAGGLRVWVHHRRTGAWGVLLFRDRRPIPLIRDFTLLAIGLTLAVQASLAASRPETTAAASGPPWQIGLVVAVVGLLTMCVAQFQLGAAWRIGIDWAARPGLVSHGLYRWSRNPIFAGLVIGLFGYALLLPTLISWIGLFATVIAVRSQVREEERYLLSTYGSAFGEYAHRVGRFVPGVGRLNATGNP